MRLTSRFLHRTQISQTLSAWKVTFSFHDQSMKLRPPPTWLLEIRLLFPNVPFIYLLALSKSPSWDFQLQASYRVHSVLSCFFTPRLLLFNPAGRGFTTITAHLAKPKVHIKGHISRCFPRFPSSGCWGLLGGKPPRTPVPCLALALKQIISLTAHEEFWKLWASIWPLACPESHLLSHKNFWCQCLYLEDSNPVQSVRWQIVVLWDIVWAGQLLLRSWLGKDLQWQCWTLLEPWSPRRQGSLEPNHHHHHHHSFLFWKWLTTKDLPILACLYPDRTICVLHCHAYSVLDKSRHLRRWGKQGWAMEDTNLQCAYKWSLSWFCGCSRSGVALQSCPIFNQGWPGFVSLNYLVIQPAGGDVTQGRVLWCLGQFSVRRSNWELPAAKFHLAENGGYPRGLGQGSPA